MTVKELLRRCHDLGIELEVVDGVLVISGREAAIEPLADVLWRGNELLIRALQPKAEQPTMQHDR